MILLLLLPLLLLGMLGSDAGALPRSLAADWPGSLHTHLMISKIA
jgi:hypothetical protein